jgi:hypothetical protein
MRMHEILKLRLNNTSKMLMSMVSGAINGISCNVPMKEVRPMMTMDSTSLNRSSTSNPLPYELNMVTNLMC